MVIWYIFPILVCLGQEKTGNPDQVRISKFSFQLETVETFRADVALLLNITPDHMDRYESLDAYAAAKYRIFRNQRESDVAIVNANDALTAAPPTAARVWSFSSTHRVEPGAWLDVGDLVIRANGESRLTRRSIAIRRHHRIEQIQE